MKFSFTSDDTAIKATVSGRISQREISPFKEPLAEAIGHDTYESVVLLDMEEVDTLDSSGVSWLLSCSKRFRQSGGKLVLHSLSPTVRNVLKVLNLQKVLTIAADEAEGLQMAQGDPE